MDSVQGPEHVPSGPNSETFSFSWQNAVLYPLFLCYGHQVVSALASRSSTLLLAPSWSSPPAHTACPMEPSPLLR